MRTTRELRITYKQYQQPFDSKYVSSDILSPISVIILYPYKINDYNVEFALVDA